MHIYNNSFVKVCRQPPQYGWLLFSARFFTSSSFHFVCSSILSQAVRAIRGERALVSVHVCECFSWPMSACVVASELTNFLFSCVSWKATFFLSPYNLFIYVNCVNVSVMLAREGKCERKTADVWREESVEEKHARVYVLLRRRTPNKRKKIPLACYDNCGACAWSVRSCEPNWEFRNTLSGGDGIGRVGTITYHRATKWMVQKKGAHTLCLRYSFIFFNSFFYLFFSLSSVRRASFAIP